MHEKSGGGGPFEASRDDTLRDRVDGRLAGSPVYDRNVRRRSLSAPRNMAIHLYEASLIRHRYLWGHLHIAKHIEPRQMAAGTRETPEYSSR